MNINVPFNPDVQIGFNSTDDAAVYELSNSMSLVHNLEVINQLPLDPYIYGRIAALNALNGIFAMGAKPFNALSFFTHPVDKNEESRNAIFDGGIAELSKHGCTLVGGQFMDDNVVRLGYSINGMAENGVIFRNNTATCGDVLIVTKKTGTGVMCDALSNGLLNDMDRQLLTESMLISNYAATISLNRFEVSAVTRIGQTGLVGCGLNMIKESRLGIIFDMFSLPVFDRALSFFATGSHAITETNRLNIQQFIDTQCSLAQQQIFFDPQISGGLLIAVNERDAYKLLAFLRNLGYSCCAVVGYVTDQFTQYPITIV